MTVVKYDLKYVRNLGNFESVHVSFGIEDSVREGEHIDAAKERIATKVDDWVSEAINQIDADAAGS